MSGEFAYLTIEDVARYLKIPRETLYKYVREGRIPASKVGRHWRFARGEIDHWILQQRDRRSAPRLNVLVVDDDEGVRRLLARWLMEAHCDVSLSSDGREALHHMAMAHFDLVFLDLVMPGLNGVETLRQIREIAPNTVVVIATAYFDGEMIDDALKLGPLMALKKPLAKEALMMLVHSLVSCGRSYSLGRV